MFKKLNKLDKYMQYALNQLLEGISEDSKSSNEAFCLYVIQKMNPTENPNKFPDESKWFMQKFFKDKVRHSDSIVKANELTIYALTILSLIEDFKISEHSEKLNSVTHIYYDYDLNGQFYRVYVQTLV